MLNESSGLESGLGLRFGFHYNNRIGQDFLLKAGLNLSSHKLRINRDYRDDIIIRSSLDIIFLEIPIVIRREMETRTFSPYIEFGIAPTFKLKTLHKSNAEMTVFDVYESEMNRVDFVLIIAGGFNYDLNEEWIVFFQPTYRFHLNGIQLARDLKAIFFNLGLEVGMRKLF